MEPQGTLKASMVLETTAAATERVRCFLLPLPDRRGYLFALCDIRATGTHSRPVLSLLEEQLTRTAQTMEVTAHALHRFEQMVEAINEQLRHASESAGWTLPAASVHALLGLMTDTHLSVTGTGDLCALYLHRNDDQRYHVYNLFRGIQTEQSSPQWSKLFSVMLD